MIPVDPQLQQWLRDTRRDLHMYPELSNEETGTTQKIIEILTRLKINVQPFADITGAVGLIQGKNKRKLSKNFPKLRMC